MRHPFRLILTFLAIAVAFGWAVVRGASAGEGDAGVPVVGAVAVNEPTGIAVRELDHSLVRLPYPVNDALVVVRMDGGAGPATGLEVGDIITGVGVLDVSMRPDWRPVEKQFWPHYFRIRYWDNHFQLNVYRPSTGDTLEPLVRFTR